MILNVCRCPEIIKKLEFISKKENVKFDDSALSLIALNSRGSFRDAESLLDECMSFSGEKGDIKTQDIKELLGIVEVGEISKFVDLLIAKNTKDAILFLNSIVDNGVDLQEFTKTLVFYLASGIAFKNKSGFFKFAKFRFVGRGIGKNENSNIQFNSKRFTKYAGVFY